MTRREGIPQLRRRAGGKRLEKERERERERKNSPWVGLSRVYPEALIYFFFGYFQSSA